MKLSPRVKPAAPATDPAKPLTATDAMHVQDVTQTYRIDQERLLEKLIAETPDDDLDKPEMMFRLAEHYAQQQRYWRFKAIEPTMPTH